MTSKLGASIFNEVPLLNDACMNDDDNDDDNNVVDVDDVDDEEY